MERKNAWADYSEDDLQKLNDVSKGYIDFISECKTERECVAASVQMAREAGYVSLDEVRAAGSIAPGAKVYADNYGKSLLLIHVGMAPLEAGVNILGAHVDSPRLDLKQNPVYEQNDFALLDTHYYGGIKKYQWTALPLAIHGVVAKPTGEVLTVNVGDDADDPVFCVTDLLPHLAAEQMDKKAAKVVEGEALDVLAGSRPKAAPEAEDDADADAPKDPVKTLMLDILQEKYGFEEEDFLSAELEVVPAGRARSCGFDESMVLGYGQDDRSCAYTSLLAQLDAPADLDRTAVCLLVDKEEIGSVGATGMTSLFFENTMAEIMELAGCGGFLPLRRCLAASHMLSSDVSAAFDPTYASAFDAKNAAFCGRGLTFNKFTGSRGKSGSNDANAEYVALIRRAMDAEGVAFQTAELGKVDVGGGGTIAYILAKYNMDVIDCGVPVLSMHAPWEVISKADLYEAYRGYKAFLKIAH